MEMRPEWQGKELGEWEKRHPVFDTVAISTTGPTAVVMVAVKMPMRAAKTGISWQSCITAAGAFKVVGFLPPAVWPHLHTPFSCLPR